MAVYQVEFNHQGESHRIEVGEDEPILKAALEKGIDLPNSCNAGVCTTCAAKLVAGTVEQGEAMGISPDLQVQGYALLCVARPRSDLQIETGCEDEVYELQFGQQS